MNRLLLLLAGLLLCAGCPTTDDDDSSMVDDDDAVADDDDVGDDDDTGDDDDSSVADDDDAADDDDSSVADDDDAADDDDSAGDDDDDSSAGDDDDSAAAWDCEPDTLLPTLVPCTLLSPTVLALDELAWNCPEGDYEFITQADWDDFLGSTCYAQPAVDPLAGFDWVTNSVVGTIQGSSGCDGYGGFHWVAWCTDGSFWFADWMVGCGECDGYYKEVHMVSIPAAVTPMGFTGCVPPDQVCDDPVDG